VLPPPLVVCFTVMFIIFNLEKYDVVSLAVVAGTSKGPEFWFMVLLKQPLPP